MSNIDNTLAERGSRYGEFPDHASITQDLKSSMTKGRNWKALPDDMKEALEMVAHKVGRILNGDPSYIDSWTDIIGYTRLVEKRLLDAEANAKAKEVPLGTTSDRNVDSGTIGNFFSLKDLLARADSEAKTATGVKPEAAGQECDCVGCQLERLGENAGDNVVKVEDADISGLLQFIFGPQAKR